MPFHPAKPRIQLEQIDRNRFNLLAGFSYTDPKGRKHTVEPKLVGKSDLSSVPWFLWWFIASYGRHTAAALLHDQLIDAIDRRYADWVFRSALKESGTPFFRRWLMWTAVSLETTFRTAFRPKDPTPDDPDRRKQRVGAWWTMAGFALVLVPLIVGIVLVAWSGLVSGEWLGLTWLQWIGVAVLAAWLAVWRERGLILFLGLAALLPALAGIVISELLIFLFLELGLLRLLIWPIWMLKERSTRFPGGKPDFQPTREPPSTPG
jgi:hypothetical protein